MDIHLVAKLARRAPMNPKESAAERISAKATNHLRNNRFRRKLPSQANEPLAKVSSNRLSNLPLRSKCITSLSAKAKTFNLNSPSSTLSQSMRWARLLEMLSHSAAVVVLD